LQETVFAVRREAYTHYELGILKSLVTLKMEAICSSETRYRVPEDMCYQAWLSLAARHTVPLHGSAGAHSV
jgi:hypothetical protein